MSDRRAVHVVGAGLVGSLLATALRRRGLPVAVHEGRPDPRSASAAGGRSINLVLTRRGLRALDTVGLAERALELTVPVTGRMMHALDGTLTYQPYGRDRSECNYSVSRGGLNRFLIEAAGEAGAELRFEATLEGLDTAAGRARFAGAADPVDLGDAVLVGADGAGSAVRGALDAAGHVEARTDWLSHGYKELTIPAGEDGAPLLEPNALHIWPRGEIMLMALANLDGSFTATLYLPFAGDRGFDSLDSAGRVERLFETQFPDALPLLPGLAADFAENPTGRLGTVYCAPWRHDDRVALIGDAAHAIVPFFGQGMNSGFEDVRVLCELVDAADGRLDGAVLAEYERRRKPQADAIAALALDNFDEMRARVGDESFLLRKAVEHRLEEVMPTRYRSRYSMVMYSHIPFAVAREAGAIQAGILDELCAGIDGPEAVDLDRARRLIDERLAPFLARHGVTLDY